MKQYWFTVYGEPMGKQRPKASSRGGFVKIYTPKETLSYEAMVKQCILEQCLNNQMPTPSLAPAEVSIIAYFGLAKGDYNSKGLLNKHGNAKVNGLEACTKKADTDNIAKIILDGGLNEFLIKDDKQVIKLTVIKKWSETPRVEVEVILHE